MRGVALIIMATVAVGAAAPTATAAEPASPLILRGLGNQPGMIHLVVLGEPGSRVNLFEIVGPVRRPLAPVVIGPFGGNAVLSAAQWTCARTARRFVATTAAGEQSYFSLRTPSCRSRVAVNAPLRARPGSRARVRLTDTFGLTGSRARLCVDPPEGRTRCRPVRLPARGRPARAAFRVRSRGQWRIVVSTRHQRTKRSIAVGVPVRERRLPGVFFTGDSMMQNIDNVISDRIADRANTTSDVYAGSALSKPGFDFVANTRKRVRKARASATVLFLGANDGFPLPTSSGPAECCGEPWIAAYTARVRRLVRAGGRRTLLITLPAPRDPELRPIFLAVNEGLRRAAARERTARLIDLVPLFTPGFVYRDFFPQRDKPLYVRETDGIHVSIDGAPFVSKLVIDELERSRIIRRR